MTGQTKKARRGDALRRQSTASGKPFAGGSGRIARLDPLSLPVRFAVPDERTDDGTRIIEIGRERVLLLRSVRGVRMRIRIPLDGFLGVAVRVLVSADETDRVAITLEHRDASLSILLHVGEEVDGLLAEWQRWGRILGLPLLIAGLDGSLRPPIAMLGALVNGETAPRRRRRTPLRKRRPYFFARRKGFSVRLAPVVHRDEREIIARN
jgi:Family of unknown function (DUF6101)